MTPAAHLAARTSLGLSQAAEARLLGVAVRTVERWDAGTSDVPPPVARLLTLAMSSQESGAVDVLAALREMAAAGPRR